MKKSINKDISYLQELFLSSSMFPERRGTPTTTFIKTPTNSYLKSGISAINGDKKHSLLAVPKTPTKTLNIFKENKPPLADLNISTENMPKLQTTREKPYNKKKLDIYEGYNNTIKSVTGRYSGINLFRTRKNPNSENLKNALIGIEKVSPKTTEKITTPEIPKEKSDIEKLIESQKSNHYNTKKSPVLSKIEKNYEIKETNEDNNSQRSDPSPVREKKSSNIERSKTSHKLNPVKANKRKIYKKKFDYESLLKNYDKVCNVSDSSNSFSKSEESLKIFDYKQESLKILKNTSTFANKIMKRIRYTARKKHF